MGLNGAVVRYLALISASDFFLTLLGTFWRSLAPVGTNWRKLILFALLGTLWHSNSASWHFEALLIVFSFETFTKFNLIMGAAQLAAE